MKPSIETIEFHGIEALRLSVGGASAVISRLGGQVLSWETSDGRERLYLSPKAVFDGSASIRGGIPVCFPQFSGLGDLPKHGLVRKLPWDVTEEGTGKDYATITLGIDSEAAGHPLFPQPWQVEVSVMLERNRLDVELNVANIGSQPLAFTGALHTYLRVVQVEDVALEGLYGFSYRDALDGNKIKRESGPELILEDAIDRVYHDVTRPLLLRAGNLSLGIHGEGFADAVIWNPWVEGCAAMADMPADGWRHMLCIEAAAARVPVTVAPGEEWSGRQTLVVV